MQMGCMWAVLNPLFCCQWLPFCRFTSKCSNDPTRVCSQSMHQCHFSGHFRLVASVQMGCMWVVLNRTFCCQWHSFCRLTSKCSNDPTRVCSQLMHQCHFPDLR